MAIATKRHLGVSVNSEHVTCFEGELGAVGAAILRVFIVFLRVIIQQVY